MLRQITSWYSERLQKDMPVAVYGNYGFALLMVPTAAADYLEYERFQLIAALEPFINSGKVKIFSVNSINNESWLNNGMDPFDKVQRHQQFNSYIFEEVIPFIKTNTSYETPVIICGASFGALHSMNLFLRRPDLINGVVAMSGVYDLTEYTKGFYNDDLYFNSPQLYMPNLTDHAIVEEVQKSSHIHIFSGSVAYEDANASRSFAGILYSKGINYELDIWGSEWKHDWETWRAVLPHYLHSRF